jgi:tight adherence protein B
MNQTTITALFVFLAVALGTLSFVLIVEAIRERTRAGKVVRQLESFANENFGPEGQAAILRDQARHGGALEPVLARLPQLHDIQRLMHQGGTKWSLTTFFLLTLGLGAGFGVGTLLATRMLLAAGVAAVFGALLPYLTVKRRAARRLNRFEELLPGAIDLMGRAIRAGHPLSAGLQMVADESSEPVAGEFLQVFEEQRFGLPFEDSMYGIADRVPLVDVRILVTAILIQREVGGNLAEVLDNLAEVIRERFKIRRQLRVITAQGRMSGYVLAALPIVVGLAIFLINRPYVMILFEHPVGKLLAVSAVVLQILGYLWIRKIVDIEI